jgi:modulator of FtsH protease HflC
MSSFRNLFALIVAAVLAVAYLSYFIVDERQKMLVSRFGDINRIVEKPGLYFKLPFADVVTPIDDRIVVWQANDRQVQDRSSQVYIVDAVTLARIADARRFRETLGASVEQAEIRVAALTDAAMRQSYGRRSFDEALSAERSTIMREIRDQVRRDSEALGIEIVDVRIRRTDLNKDVLDRTYARMASERNALAANLRSRGEADKVRLNAETDRLYAERTASARKDSEIIRGRADADRNRIFAAAFEKDPEFFEFYRSMQAYSTALANGDTTMVLDPGSDFFKYFGAQSRAVPAPPAP